MMARDEDRCRRTSDNDKWAEKAGNHELAVKARYSIIACALALPLCATGLAWASNEVYKGVMTRLDKVDQRMERMVDNMAAQTTAMAVQTNILAVLVDRVEGLENRERSR